MTSSAALVLIAARTRAATLMADREYLTHAIAAQMQALDQVAVQVRRLERTLDEITTDALSEQAAAAAGDMQ